MSDHPDQTNPPQKEEKNDDKQDSGKETTSEPNKFWKNCFKQVTEFLKTATTFGIIGYLGRLAITQFKLCSLFSKVKHALLTWNVPVLRSVFSNSVLAATGASLALLAGANRYFNGSTWRGAAENNFTPNLKDKVIIITGANTGLGFETAKEMAVLGPKAIVFACRNKDRATNAIKRIRDDLKGDPRIENDKELSCLVFIRLDLADLASVKTFAAAFKKKFDRLDILLNNAGIMALPERKVTLQGYEK